MRFFKIFHVSGNFQIKFLEGSIKCDSNAMQHKCFVNEPQQKGRENEKMPKRCALKIFHGRGLFDGFHDGENCSV
jgi:hypothetical protein